MIIVLIAVYIKPGEVGERAFASIYLIWHGTISLLEEPQNLTGFCQEKNISLLIGYKANTHHVVKGAIQTTINRKRTD